MIEFIELTNPSGARYRLDSKSINLPNDATSITLVYPGRTKTLWVNEDIDDMVECWGNWIGGELIQNAFSRLSIDEREFLITGMLPSEWDEMFTDDLGDE